MLLCGRYDLDCDGAVTVFEIQAIAERCWADLPPAQQMIFDLDGDGEVDIVDIQTMIAAWETR